MLTPFVIRLAQTALAAGVLAGEAEHVLTGERSTFRDAGELQAWCAAFGVGQPVPPPRPAQDRTADLR